MESKNQQDGIYQIAEVEVIYRSKVKASERPKITTSRDAYQMFIQQWDSNVIELQEQFMVMYLNRANKVMFIHELSTGGLTGTVADPRLIFCIALKTTASAILIAHNHPSGNLMPSKADEDLTQKIKEASKFLDIKLLDHLIITEDSYYSFADQGLV